MRNSLLLGLGLVMTSGAYANGIEQIPNQSGFSGFVHGGVSVMEYQSNFYSNGDDDERNESGSANSVSGVNPLINLDLRYTFADSRTQVFLGNLIQDAIRFDFTQQLGVRQQIGDKGILAGSLVFNAMPTEQWADPFDLRNKNTTDIESKGVRLAWNKIWGSNFNASLTSRKVEVDNEQSGKENDPSYASMLDRNGKLTSMQLAYQWQIAPGHSLEPAFIYREADLDGKAQSYESNGLQLTYATRGNKWSLVSNAYVGASEYEAANPIFGRKADSNELALTSTLFWHQLFGIAPLSATVTAGFTRSDSDISFYDSEAAIFSTGLLYNF